MLLVAKMNVDEREEGELTEYEDISSDEEEILLRQRIAEIEATNLELEKLATFSDKVNEKENTKGNKKQPQRKSLQKEVVALPTSTTSPRILQTRRNSYSCQPTKLKPTSSASTATTTRRRRPRKKPNRNSNRRRRNSCQLIVSEDEFDSYDQQLPLGTENLSPDPLPIDDDVIIINSPSTEKQNNHTRKRTVTVVEIQDEDEDDDSNDLELKLRLEALASKQEIKNDLQVILDQTQKEQQKETTKPKPSSPPEMDEEQELRLIALKSAIVKKHLVRKKKKEEARPYSPTDVLENFDVPSPPLSAQNMDISPLGTPSPVVFDEQTHPVDMEIANEESQSPIFFSCQINPEPEDSTTVQVDIKLDPTTVTVVGDSGYDDEDPDKLRAFLLQKIGAAAKRNPIKEESKPTKEAVKCEETSNADKTKDVIIAVAEAQRIIEHRSSDGGEKRTKEPMVDDADEDDEHVLRANLLSKARQFKRAKSEEAVPITSKPLSEILTAQSKKVLELKSICRTIENDSSTTPLVISPGTINSTPSTVNTPLSSPKPTTPTRSALINQLPSNRVTPVIISLRASDQDSTTEFTDEEDDEEFTMDLDDNQSPLSFAMDSPQYSSSPVPMEKGKAGADGLKENFDLKLSEFLKKARQSTGEKVGGENGVVANKTNRVSINKRIVSNRQVVKQAVTVNSDRSGAPSAAVKHLPPSTQLEYNRLISRMHQLEKQKAARTKRLEQKQQPQQPKKQTDGQVCRPPPAENGEIPKPQMTVIKKSLGTETGFTVVVQNDRVMKPTVPEVKQVPLKTKEVGAAAAAAVTTTSPGRVTLKDRLKSLTGEQMKMLLDVQQRKVVNKRKTLHESLDSFLATIDETMQANRQQIRVELEVRKLRRMLMVKEQQLAEQRQLCGGELHGKLQSQYKSVVVARQSLATTSAQCLEIGKSARCEDGLEMSFRLTDEASEGLGVKYRKYKEEIESYKELRGKIKRGIFTIADLKKKSCSPDVVQKEQKGDEESGVVANSVMGNGGDIVINERPERGEEMNEQTTLHQNDIQSQLPGETKIAKQICAEEKSEKATNPSFAAYKSPLEHMEFLDTANPNGILCPFQMNGTCQDARCEYRHFTT